MTEGYIKFRCDWKQEEIQIPEELFRKLEVARSRLYELELIGMNPDGIGFGNISVRTDKQKSFFITGSATGQHPRLNPEHYALVSGYSFKLNSVSCLGLTKASAESLTHAAVYESLPEVGAVVHVHCFWMWKKLLNIYPTTSADVEYGTPEMAYAVKEVAGKTTSHFEKIIIMGGHQEGILAFANTLEEAVTAIINLYKKYKND